MNFNIYETKLNKKWKANQNMCEPTNQPNPQQTKSSNQTLKTNIWKQNTHPTTNQIKCSYQQASHWGCL